MVASGGYVCGPLRPVVCRSANPNYVPCKRQIEELSNERFDPELAR